MAFNNSVTNIAGVVSAVSAVVVFSNATAVTIGTLPPNAQIVDVNIDTTVAFNAGTTNTVTVGKSGTVAAFVASTSVTAVGRQNVATTGVYTAWADTGATEVDATVTFTQTGAAATTGAARVTVVYKTFA